MINTSIFNILPRNDLHKDLNLNSQKKYIAIGAQSILLDENKGFGKFIEAITKINRNDFEIIVFGTNNLNTTKINNINIRNFGIINDYNLLIKIYNISDAMIVPSIQESFGQTALESLSCGTPVVCFATSGLNEIIDHKINGYKAIPYDSEDLARGIEWVLDYDNSQNLRNNARLKAINSYDSSIIVNKYIKIYSSLTENKNE
jgi:glycosyltransferase involved in cell wall biosynthesis